MLNRASGVLAAAGPAEGGVGRVARRIGFPLHCTTLLLSIASVAWATSFSAGERSMKARERNAVGLAGLCGIIATVAAGVVVVPVVREYLEESELITQLESGSMEQKKEAATKLSELQSVRAAPALLKIVREIGGLTFIMKALIAIAPKVTPLLTDGLSDESEEVRCCSALILGDARIAEAVPYLVRKLDHQNRRDRVCAVVALRNLGPIAADAVPKLVQTLTNDDSSSVRGGAAHALWRIGAAARPAVPALIDSLKHDDQKLRVYAALALLSVTGGEVAREEVVAVIEADMDEAMKNAADWVRKDAQELVKATQRE